MVSNVFEVMLVIFMRKVLILIILQGAIEELKLYSGTQTASAQCATNLQVWNSRTIFEQGISLIFFF